MKSGLMAKVKSDLGLQTWNEDGSREAAALVAAMTTSVEELHPHSLKGYGILPEPIANYMEGRLTEIGQVVKRIDQCLAKPEAIGKPER